MRNIRRRHRSKKAISEVVGSILMLSITIAVGFAAWAWTQSAAGNSEASFNAAAGEKFTIVASSFTSSNPSNPPGTSNPAVSLTIWVYNGGTVVTKLGYVMLSVASISPGACPLTSVSTFTTTSSTTTITTSTTVFMTYTTTSTTVVSTATSTLNVDTMSSFSLPLSPSAPWGSLVTINAVGQYGFHTTYEVQYC